MMLEILDLPEEPREIAVWLDRQLASDGLAAIVDDLSAIHGAAAEPCSAEQARDWLGDSASGVLANGLTAIGDERIKQLLVRPSLLPALQELVMLEGGPYWDNLLHHSAGVQESLSRARSALSSVITDPTSTSKHPVTSRSEQGNRRYLFTLIPLAVAAMLALMITWPDAGDRPDGLDAGKNVGGSGITRGPGSGEAGKSIEVDQDQPWGWNRETLIPKETAPDQIANMLADRLEEWSNVTHTDRLSKKVLRLRFSEVWAGCETLLGMSFDKAEPEVQASIKAVAEALQAGVQKSLDDLTAVSGDDVDALKSAKQAVDTLVKNAVDALRDLAQ
jgi:hypothetical protein